MRCEPVESAASELRVVGEQVALGGEIEHVRHEPRLLFMVRGDELLRLAEGRDDRLGDGRPLKFPQRR